MAGATDEAPFDGIVVTAMAQHRFRPRYPSSSPRMGRWSAQSGPGAMASWCAIRCNQEAGGGPVRAVGARAASGLARLSH